MAAGGQVIQRPPVEVAPLVVAPPASGLDVLLPDRGSDREVARVGELVLRESDAFRRLLVAHPRVALAAVDLLVFDALIAEHAHRFGITVPEARIDEAAAADEAAARAEAAREDCGFETWVWRTFGMATEDWRVVVRRRAAQRLWQGYVVRYVAGLEDRVQARFAVVADHALALAIAAKTRAGADFGVLAQRHSEDPSRQTGGLLPPFARDFEHPVASVAFGLAPGEVSAPFRAPWGDGERWFVVCCVEHLPANPAPFATVAAAIAAELDRRPLSPLETTAYTLRWRPSASAIGPPAVLER